MSAGLTITTLSDIEIQRALWISKAHPGYKDWRGATQMFFGSRPFVEFQKKTNILMGGQWAAISFPGR